ncbi:MAG: protein kinase domain-containing protein [Bacteroidota bacterium]
MPLSPGTRIGAYEIVRPLGAGGMGEVYRAKDLRLGRDVAMKVLPERLASSPGRLARLEREARTVAGLNHPNIVTLFSIEDEDGVRFLTMELIEGQTLSNLVTPGGLPLSRLLDVAIPLADALVTAHERGIVHRDLKPGNVMITREGRVKVLDFGLARIDTEAAVLDSEYSTIEASGDAHLTREGRVLGTVPYMSPEQVRGETADARSDLFALGILLYELATGRRPFPGRTPGEISASILHDTPAPPSSFRTDLASDLERIIARCLEKNPRERAQTALDICNELRRLKHGLERGAVPEPARHGVASIAVLPFVNRSRDAEDEYFSDGLADELLNMLTKIRGLRVVARTSAFQFKGAGADIATIGQKLNVATILEGSVRKAGNRMRIAVQLVKVSDSSHLWSEIYDRAFEDIFAVQDDIARAVVKELRTTLLGEEADSRASGEVRAEVARAAKGRSKDAEAHRLYLQGRHLIDRFTQEDTANGIDYLRQALARDPDFALAWAELARGYSSLANVGWIPVDEGYARAREAVKRALSLEPDLAEGHAVLGSIQILYDWDWRGAEASYRRALELAPGNAGVLHRSTVLALYRGRTDEMVALYRSAIEQDPLSSATYNNFGHALHMVGRLTEAETVYRKALELAPQRLATHALLSMALMDQGRTAEALEEAGREPEAAFRLWALTILNHALGQGAESDAALRELIEKHAAGWAYQIAEAHAARGEADAAFEWLDRASIQRDGGLSDVKASTRFRSLHDDPRWSAFLRKIGFDE